jgi:citrate lyase subunit beta / citryl-CoA lyase
MQEIRSILFVPGDSEKKLTKAVSTLADALVLDLEDAVTAEHRPRARSIVLEYLRGRPKQSRQQTWVRINPLSDNAVSLADLSAIVAGAPDVILLPKVSSAQDVIKLDHFLTALEAREGLAVGDIGIVPVATETPQAVLMLASYQGCSTRLRGLTWGAEDLSAAIGASTNLDDTGEWEFTYRMARSLCLLAAHAARVQAIDTITVDFRDEARLRREVANARRSGFTGKMAIHPNQIDVINAGFAPDAAELSHAQAIVDAFAANPNAGALQIGGKMVDRPHWVQAMKVLARA